jgi:CRISPR/Cas system CMR subunit Cmr6 (Cas7 group RAMP superfamily)
MVLFVFIFQNFFATIRTAFRGAGQTSWHTPQPVQALAFTRGMPFSTMIAFGTGQRSEHVEQKLR